MLLQINTDIDEQIKKCDELLSKYEQLEEHTKKLHFVTAKELAEMRGCSLSTALAIFNLPDFPRRRFSEKKKLFCLRH